MSPTELSLNEKIMTALDIHHELYAHRSCERYSYFQVILEVFPECLFHCGKLLIVIALYFYLHGYPNVC